MSVAYQIQDGDTQLVDDTVDYAKRVEIEWVTWHASVLNLEVLIVEIVEESWSVMSTVRLGEEVEV